MARRRMLPALAIVLASSFLRAQAIGSCSIAEHFIALREAMPERIGDCRGPEQIDPASGDLVQPTAGGWLVLREADAIATFTDGVRTWLFTGDGVSEISDDTTKITLESEPPNNTSKQVELPSTDLKSPQVTSTPAVGSGEPHRIDEPAASLLARSELVDSFSHSGNPTELRGAQWSISIESRAVSESQHVATYNRERYSSQQRALSGLGSTLLSAALRGFYRTIVLVTLPPGVQLTDRAIVDNRGGRTIRPDGSVLLPGGTFASILIYGNGIPPGTRGYMGPDSAKLVVFYSPDHGVNPRDEDMMDGTLIADVSSSFGPNFASRRQGGLNRYITYFFVQQAIRGPNTGGIGHLMRSYEGNWGYTDAIGFHGVLLHYRSDWKPGVEPTPRPPMPTATPRPPGFDPRWFIEKGKIFGCLVYQNQAQAQAVLRADPTDPNRLDLDRNGIACELLMGTGGNRDSTPVIRPPE